jgi:hypothetical protein
MVLKWCGAMVPENTPILVCARQSMLHGAFGSTYDTTVYPYSLQKSIEIHGYLLVAPNAVNPNNVNDTKSKSQLWNWQVEPLLPLSFTAQDDVGYLAALHAEPIPTRVYILGVFQWRHDDLPGLGGNVPSSLCSRR